MLPPLSHRWSRRAGMACAVALTLSLTASAWASGDLTTLATELTKLRAEVESLSDSIAGARADTQARLRSVSGQKTELEVQVQREELRLAQIKQERARHLERVARSTAAKDELEPTVLESIARVRASVDASLPFKRAERVEALDAIEKQLRSGLLRPEKAAARLWQFAEDELRLTRESGLYQQTVTLDGEEFLAEVAKIGMVAMYFKTADGRVGRIVKRSGSWVTERLDSERETEQVLGLFDDFKKGIRQGFFELPNPAPR